MAVIVAATIRDDCPTRTWRADVIRVFIVAETRLYCDGLAHLLGQTDGIEVVGAAADAASAADALHQVRAEIVLLDMAAPDAFQAIQQLRAVPDAPKLVALAVPNDEGDLLACAEAGVSGYVTRDDSLETMVAAIACVARGELLTTPRIAAALFERLFVLHTDDRSERAARLTRRELEIVGLIADGLSNKAIARQLTIEVATVKNHVHNILEKLQVERRADAAARVRRAAPQELDRPARAN
jgi:two-component system, NarL family, nitrate/nitrite response regulator NarL